MSPYDCFNMKLIYLCISVSLACFGGSNVTGAGAGGCESWSCGGCRGQGGSVSLSGARGAWAGG